MFCVIYKFKVIPGQQEVFKSAWAALTQIIYEHAGSLGSRLHAADDHQYIAYAQWPDKESWEQASTKLPDKAAEVSKQMRASCKEIKTSYELDLVDDLLKSKPFKK